MPTIIAATYENGVLKPIEPLLLPEGAKVSVTIAPSEEDFDPLESVIGIGDSGRVDGANQHDHYIYGTPKR